MCQCVFGMAIVVLYFIDPQLPLAVSIYGLANNNKYAMSTYILRLKLSPNLDTGVVKTDKKE